MNKTGGGWGGSDRVKLTKSDKVELDEKCHYASDILFEWSPCFIVILFYIERKRLFMRNLTTVSPWKSELSGQFQRFNAIDGSIEMLRNS